MNAFVTTLHTQVDQAVHALEQARQAGDTEQVHRHGARLLDLLDRASAHGVDTADWVAPGTVVLATAVAGADA